MFQRSRLPFFLLFLLIIVLAAATAVEHAAGTAAAHAYIYKEWWFVLLWAAVFATSVGTLVKEWRRIGRNAALWAIHGGLTVVLLGAVTSFLTSESGTMGVRRGITERAFLPDEGDGLLKRLPFRVDLDSFYIERHAASQSPADYVSLLRIDGRPTRVSMNRPADRAGYRLYQQSFDTDLNGTRLIVRYDPWGRPLTFAGYALLGLGLLGLFLRRPAKTRAALPALAVLSAGTVLGGVALLFAPLDAPFLRDAFSTTSLALRPFAVLYLAVGVISSTAALSASRAARRLRLACDAIWAVGFVFLSLHLLFFMLQADRWPLGCGYETMWAAAWLVHPFGLWLRRTAETALTSGLPLLAAGFFLLVSTIGGDAARPAELAPVLSGPLLAVHVSTVMMAYALLCFTFLLSLGGLFFPRESLKLRNAGLLLLRPAVALLTAGIFLGAVWGDAAWGRYWGWDAKEVWALVTLLIYTMPLHRRLHGRLTEVKSYHLYMVFAFLAVLMTYLGAGYLLGGMHSYA